MKLLVTGGAGFIGSHFVRQMLLRRDVRLLVNLDKLTYAGHLENLTGCDKDKRYRFVRGDISDGRVVEHWMRRVDHVVNFAAETHVDRSLMDAAPFLQTNVIGTQTLLDAARQAGIKRFLHISTDEVYGSITRGAASESAPLNPSSPYSASKAAADYLVMAQYRTYGLPVLITRASNTYGLHQYPEKFLPLFITRALERQPLPLYGDGRQVRDWLHVSDHCRGIECVLRKGRPGSIYNIGGGKGYRNRQVAQLILKQLRLPRNLVRAVKDRPGHDRRYAVSVKKIRQELGWRPLIPFEFGLSQLIDWYQSHESWWKPILHKDKGYRRFYARQYARRTA
jgi:dTDP-glucose 4,6-dehydratase